MNSDDLDDGPVMPRPQPAPPAPISNTFTQFTDKYGVFPYFKVNHDTPERARDAQNAMLQELLTNLNVSHTRNLPFLRMPATANLLTAFHKLFIARCELIRFTDVEFQSITPERPGIYHLGHSMYFVSSKDPARYQVNRIDTYTTNTNRVVDVLRRIDWLKALMAVHYSQRDTLQDICSLICENPRPLRNSEMTVLLRGRHTFFGTIPLLTASVALQLDCPEEDILWLPVSNFRYLHILLLQKPHPQILVFRYPPVQAPFTYNADVYHLGASANANSIPHFIRSTAQYHRNLENADPEQADASIFWRFVMSVIAEKRRLSTNNNGIRHISFTAFIDKDNALRMGPRAVPNPLAAHSITSFLRTVTKFLLDDNTAEAIPHAPMQFATAHGLVEYFLWDHYRFNGTITSGDIAIQQAQQAVDDLDRAPTPPH